MGSRAVIAPNLCPTARFPFDPRDLLGTDRADDGLGFLAALALEEGAHGGVVLHRPNTGMVKGNL